MNIKKALFLIILVSCALPAQPQVLLPNASPVTENFDAMGASLTLPANWEMHHSTTPTWSGGTTTLTQQASSGSPVTGGAYNWGSTAGERAVGVMSSGSWANHTSYIGWFQNSHATDHLFQLDVSYDLERYRVNTAAASVQFYYSTDGSAWTAVSAGDIAAGSLPTGTSAYGFNPPNLIVNVTTFSITGISIPPGSDLYLRWNLNTTGTNSQGIGIDNVTVTPYFCTAAVITSHPAGIGVCTGSNASFAVSATGAGITYQWQLSTNGGASWSNLSDNATYSGSTLDILNITGATAGMNAYRYRCIVTMAGCNAYTNSAILNVQANPSISQQPQNVTGPVGSNASFFIVSSGTSTWQWQESIDGGTTWNNLASLPPYSGTATNNLLISGINAGMSGYQYRCVVTGCAQTVNSNAATLTIGAATGTQFQPGDLVFIGYDAKVGTGAGCSTNTGTDKYYILTLVDIAPNTNFKIVNSRFESGAAANVRTNKWFSSGNSTYFDPAYISLTWNGGSVIPKGSVIAVNSSSLSPFLPTQIDINGVANIANFIITGQSSCNISSSAADQIYLMQGSFTPFGTPGNSGYYNLFNGKVLFGLTNFANWVPLTSACPGGSADADRVSRLPDDIECFNLFSASNREVYYYLNSANHVGTHRQLLLDIMNTANWSQPGSTSCLDITEDYSGATNAAIGKFFTVNAGNTLGTWIGDVSVDWFNCRNWEGLTVPDASLDVTVSSLAVRDCKIDVIGFAASAAKFGNLAQCKNILVSANKLILEASPLNVLAVGGFLRIASTGIVDMDDGFPAVADGNIYLTGNWINQVGDAAFLEGNSMVYFLGTTNQTLSTSLGLETFSGISLDNSLGLKLFNSVNVQGNFDMLNGIVTVSDTINDILTFKDNATVSNVSGLSFAAGKVSKEGNDTFTFPVGETGTGYRPIGISPPASITDIFTAEYIRSNARLLGPITVAGLNHVSACEYWTMVRDNGSSVIDVIASYDTSSCGVTSLADLVLAHFDEFGSSSWDNYGSVGSASGTLAAGTVTWYGVTTFSPFSLASLTAGNPLPVEWLSFTGRRDEKVHLEWVTGSELNSDHFDILRSRDGITFEKSGEARAAGNSSQPTYYRYEEDPGLSASILYYRLKQVDSDGQFEYSRILALDAGRHTSYIRIAPNPFSDMLNVWIDAENAQLASYRISDPAGRSVKSGEVSLQDGMNAVSLEGFSTLPNGMYFLELYLDGEYLHHRIQVQH